MGQLLGTAGHILIPGASCIPCPSTPWHAQLVKQGPFNQ